MDIIQLYIVLLIHFLTNEFIECGLIAFLQLNKHTQFFKVLFFDYENNQITFFYKKNETE